MNIISSIDNYVVYFFQSLQNPIMDKILAVITTLGELGIIWIIISLILIFTKKYRKAGITALVAIIIGGLFSEVILKNLIKRPRPFLVLENINMAIKHPKTYSFPSGHTTSSIAAMLGIYKNVDCKYIKISVVVIALLMIISRLYFGVHYITDILGGLVLGVISYFLAVKAIQKWGK